MNFNYDAQLQGSLAKQPASLAVQTHVHGTDRGAANVRGDGGPRPRRRNPAILLLSQLLFLKRPL